MIETVAAQRPNASAGGTAAGGRWVGGGVHRNAESVALGPGHSADTVSVTAPPPMAAAGSVAEGMEFGHDPSVPLNASMELNGVGAAPPAFDQQQIARPLPVRCRPRTLSPNNEGTAKSMASAAISRESSPEAAASPPPRNNTKKHCALDAARGSKAVVPILSAQSSLHSVRSLRAEKVP